MKVIDKFLTKADGLEGYSMCCKMVSRNVEILKVESKNDELEYKHSCTFRFIRCFEDSAFKSLNIFVSPSCFYRWPCV